MKKTIIISCIVILLILCIGTWLYEGSIMPVSAVFTDNLVVLESEIFISGDTNNSSMGFSGFDYKIINNEMFIRLKYSLVSSVHRLGRYEIRVFIDTKDIEKIFLKGRPFGDLKEIWKRE